MSALFPLLLTVARHDMVTFSSTFLKACKTCKPVAFISERHAQQCTHLCEYLVQEASHSVLVLYTLYSLTISKLIVKRVKYIHSNLLSYYVTQLNFLSLRCMG